MVRLLGGGMHESESKSLKLSSEDDDDAIGKWLQEYKIKRERELMANVVGKYFTM